MARMSPAVDDARLSDTVRVAGAPEPGAGARRPPDNRPPRIADTVPRARAAPADPTTGVCGRSDRRAQRGHVPHAARCGHADEIQDAAVVRSAGGLRAPTTSKTVLRPPRRFEDTFAVIQAALPGLHASGRRTSRRARNRRADETVDVSAAPGVVALCVVVVAFAYLCFAVLGALAAGQGRQDERENAQIENSLKADPVPVTTFAATRSVGTRRAVAKGHDDRAYLPGRRCCPGSRRRR